MIVDTRTPDEFRKVRIPGSINLPPYALKTKTYLASKRLLLIGRAGSGAELEPTCRTLREAGFASVGILEGGLNLWAREAGPIVGEGATRRGLSALSAADFVREPRPDAWLVVDASSRGASVSDGLPSGAAHIPLDDGARFRRELGELVRERHARPDPFVLLVGGGAELDDRLATEVANLDLPNVYFLAGGIDGYRRHLAQRDAGRHHVAKADAVEPCGSR